VPQFKKRDKLTFWEEKGITYSRQSGFPLKNHRVTEGGDRAVSLHGGQHTRRWRGALFLRAYSGKKEAIILLKKKSYAFGEPSEEGGDGPPPVKEAFVSGGERRIRKRRSL